MYSYVYIYIYIYNYTYIYIYTLRAGRVGRGGGGAQIISHVFRISHEVVRGCMLTRVEQPRYRFERCRSPFLGTLQSSKDGRQESLQALLVQALLFCGVDVGMKSATVCAACVRAGQARSWHHTESQQERKHGKSANQEYLSLRFHHISYGSRSYTP